MDRALEDDLSLQALDKRASEAERRLREIREELTSRIFEAEQRSHSSLAKHNAEIYRAVLALLDTGAGQ